jgi:5-(carboxyamino)imidazole ribonucleotide synthase
VLDPDLDAPAAQLADYHIARPWTDPEALAEVAERCAAVTIEFENVPADVLRALAAHVPVHPRADAVAQTQDRVTEKSFLRKIDIPTTRWSAIRTESECAAAFAEIGGPAILKTARMGYDGKGQAGVDSSAALLEAFRAMNGAPCILEAKVTLEREISIMVARGSNGDVVTWPAAENVHRNGILHSTLVRARVPDAVSREAQRLAERIVTALDYIGVMGVECFLVDDNKLLVNELAPRPHNSGHWTLDASAISQFEQQVRCVAGLPLGDTSALCPVAMVNILGDLWAHGEPRWDRALAVHGVRLHLYGKREPRPGRKMGHLTAVAASATEALAKATQAWEFLTPPR